MSFGTQLNFELFLRFWIHVAFQVTIISGFAVGVGYLVRHQPATRNLVMILTLLLCLVSPLSSHLLQDYGVSFYSFNAPGDGGIRSVAPRALAGHAEAVKRGKSARQSVHRAASNSSTVRERVAQAKPPADDPTPNGAKQLARPWDHLIAPIDWAILGGTVISIWCLGVVVFGLGTVAGYVRLLRLLKSSTDSSDAALARVVQEVCERLEVTRVPRLRSTTANVTPLAVGVVRPTIVIPSRICSKLDREQLRCVITHEVAHLKRWDPMIAHLQHVANVLFWPHPFVRIVNRWLSISREELCDNYVLAANKATSYCRALLKASELAQRPYRPLVSVGLLTRGWKLESRIAGLLTEKRCRGTHADTRARMLLCGVSLLFLFLPPVIVAPPFAGQQITRAEAESSNERSAQAVDGDTVHDVATSSAALESVLRTIEASKSLEELERDASALLNEYEAAAERGLICSRVANAFHSLKSHQRTAIWAQTALKYPLEDEGRRQMLEVWCDAQLAVGDRSWNAYLPAAFAYIEAVQEKVSPEVYDRYIGQLARVGHDRRHSQIREAVAHFDLSAMPTRINDSPRWAVRANACSFCYRLDWNRFLDAAIPSINTIAGDRSFAQDLLNSVREDPNGPRIDVRMDLLQHFSGHITFCIDYRDPLLAQGRRLLVGIQVRNRDALMKTLQRMFRNDPYVRRVEINGFTAWGSEEESGQSPYFVCVAQDWLLIGSDLEQIRAVAK